MTVTVKGPTWNVTRIRYHLPSEMIASHFYRCIGAFCPLCGVENILQKTARIVNVIFVCICCNDVL